MGIEQKAGDMGIVTASLEQVVNWSRSNAMWPLLFGLACCAIEMMGAQSANYDLSRFGMEINRASPRQADLMIVAGRVSRKMAPVVRRLYDQMADPKWVIAWVIVQRAAVCSTITLSFKGSMRLCRSMCTSPGCPPRPEALIDGIIHLHEKVRRMRLDGTLREPVHLS